MLLQEIHLFGSSSLAGDAALSWLLRVCVAMTFLGHGVLATQTQAGWYTYMATVGVGRKIAGPLMRVCQWGAESTGRGRA
jgi:hypothetical protein